MNTQFTPRDNVYFIANAIFVQEAQIVKCAAGKLLYPFYRSQRRHPAAGESAVQNFGRSKSEYKNVCQIIMENTGK